MLPPLLLYLLRFKPPYDAESLAYLVPFAAACLLPPRVDMLLLLLPSLRVKSAAAVAAHGDSGVLCTISPSVLEDVVAAIIPSGFSLTF